jgi:putative ABC transport system substrate-binding protein
MPFNQLKRREFITLLGGAAAWPLGARAQQGERMRRIGVLMNTAADDPMIQNDVSAFREMLQQRGWTEGGNAGIEIRWAGGDAAEIRRHAPISLRSRRTSLFVAVQPA